MGDEGKKIDVVRRAVGILAEDGPMTAGQLGLRLWWRRSLLIVPDNKAATMFCRPAGRLLWRAFRQGLVRYEEKHGGRIRLWLAREG
jgi:hypothetical protein